MKPPNTIRAICFILAPLACFGQGVRIDFNAFTISGSPPPGAYAPVLAVPGASVAVCGDAACATSAQTYTDTTLASTCPNNAPMTLPGSPVCVSTTAQTGAGGFNIAAQTTWYKITLPNGTVYGPYVVTGSGGGSTSAFVGLTAQGAQISQNPALTNGGYLVLNPITYNPYNSVSTCLDWYGNVVHQPLPVTGQAFGPNSAVIWVSTSPTMPSNGSCGTQLPVNLDYEIDTNVGILARGGLATDLNAYNAIQTLSSITGAPTGGVSANSITMGTLYPAGTLTTTGPLAMAAYLGGHIDMGHSIGPPCNGTIATCNNPYSGDEGAVQGQAYFDDTLGCPQVYNGSAFVSFNNTAGCGGGGGGGSGSPGGPISSIQFNNPLGTFAGSAQLIFNSSVNELILGGASPGSVPGIIAPVFNCTNTGATNCLQSNTGTFMITGAGAGGFQSLAATNSVSIGTSSTGTILIPQTVGINFVPNATNSNSTFRVTPSGTATQTNLDFFNSSSTTNFGELHVSVSGATVNIFSAVIGSGVPITVQNFGEGFGSAALTVMNYNFAGATQASLTSAGLYTAQSLASVGGITAGAGSWGLTAAGVLNVSSCTGCTVVTYCQAAGTNTITCAGIPVPGSYTAGMEVTILIAVTNTGATTVNINSLGAKAVQSAGSALSGGELVAGNLYNLFYDGTQFNLASSLGGVTSFNTRTGAVTLANADVTTAVGQDLNTSGTPHWASATAVIFNCSATTTAPCITQASGTWQVLGSGTAGFQAVNITNGFTTGATGISTPGPFGMTAAGVLTAGTIAGTTGTFSSTMSITGASTHTGNSTFGGTVGITGAATLSSTLAVTGNFTVNGAYGLTSAGALTIASCSGCPGSPAGTNTQVQFTNGSIFQASSAFTFNSGTNVLSVTGGVASLVFNCTATSTTNCMQQQSGTFAITGDGNAAFQGLTVQNASAFTGGLTTGAASNSVFYTGTGGNFYDRPLLGAPGVSTGVSCSGVADGWMAISSDDYVVVCLGHARFRALLLSF